MHNWGPGGISQEGTFWLTRQVQVSDRSPRTRVWRLSGCRHQPGMLGSGSFLGDEGSRARLGRSGGRAHRSGPGDAHLRTSVPLPAFQVLPTFPSGRLYPEEGCDGGELPGCVWFIEGPIRELSPAAGLRWVGPGPSPAPLQSGWSRGGRPVQSGQSGIRQRCDLVREHAGAHAGRDVGAGRGHRNLRVGEAAWQPRPGE